MWLCVEWRNSYIEVVWYIHSDTEILYTSENKYGIIHGNKSESGIMLSKTSESHGMHTSYITTPFSKSSGPVN